jgi:hypothetical protein
VTLADARAKRDAARRLIASGVDPAAKAKLDKVAASVAAANTFEAVAKELLAKTEREGLSAITLKKNRWLIGFITPALGCRPISEITAHELLSVLRIVETRGGTKPPNGCAPFAALEAARCGKGRRQSLTGLCRSLRIRSGRKWKRRMAGAR